MEFTLVELRNNSFRHIVDVLAESGRIHESKSSRGTCGLSFSPLIGNDVVLCRDGDMCRNHHCRFHHLHWNLDQISENYRLCYHNETCRNARCRYRHTNHCAYVMSTQDQWQAEHYQEYSDLVKALIVVLDEDEATLASLDPDNEVPEEMIPVMICDAHQTGNCGLLAELKQQGYDTEF